jgi:sugar lactone lactonase YvrE
MLRLSSTEEDPRMHLRTKFAAYAFVVVSMTLVLIAPVHATEHVRVVTSFDVAAGELPEGVAVDKRGNVYVSLIAPVSEIRKITPEGEQSLLVDLGVGGLGPLGLAVDAPGNVYAGVVTFDAATQGVYRIVPDGTATRLPGSEAIGFANGLAFDKRGNLYATDTIAGAVWRIPPGGEAALWVQDPLLVGTGVLDTGFPVGANGIAYRGGEMIVSNTEQGTLVRIPILPDGSAGTPAVLIADEALFGSDGITVDVLGSIYVAVIAQSTIVRVTGESITTLADETDGINQASSLAFGTGRVDRKSLFAVNFGIFSPTPTPELLEIPVGVPGAPVP